MREQEAGCVQDASARAQAWTRYWASGARHSCTGSFDDHYGTATQAFWRAQFLAINAKERVLELGCGNGSLIRLLNDADRKCWPARIDGVDLARLDAGWLDLLQPDLRTRVQVHPNTSAAALPVADGEINWLFSQFALEYFASEPVWRELARVAAPSATIAAIMHHRGSHLFRLAQVEHAHCDWLLASGGPLDHAKRMLPLLAGGSEARQGGKALRMRTEFNAVFAALGERAVELGFGDVLHETAEKVMRILSVAETRGESESASALDELMCSVQGNRLRVAELAAHALDDDALEGWAQRLRSMGFADIEIGEVIEHGHLVGWRLCARRR
ncbi:class I SAM-dependent methyltransferase [Sinimarinibacterium sp. CAU 1509]|uniref:class I SAM-dependent methyltransferase n=1 Tax=Sinimarinibacterium sp. CAU 1509 TaxID=2562283 RepID=UPI0010AD24A0|nr:class I SAM-dependent methyltransferase [Sinimarinibacterium sp. CAU 1509]TJY59278.1 class I SAM-dependent methyltransferase [Sinimarinibacterium sp. CAU 1509]